jgi:hypothetical protein
MPILKAGVRYFALVFGAGFVLGTIRTMWIVPRLGTRTAELMETPIMFVVTILAARWIVLRLAVPSTPFARLGMGCIAIGLLLVAEFGLVLSLRGLSIREYLATRDPVSGTVYCSDHCYSVWAIGAYVGIHFLWIAKESSNKAVKA